MDPKIISDKKGYLVLNKPAGWIVNDAQTVKDNPVVQTWLHDNYDYEIAKDAEYRCGIVHRLDKETSGILIIAKTKEAFDYLQSLFKKRQIKKRYTALVRGEVETNSGVIKASVGRLPWNRKRFGVLPGGRSAETKYKVIGIFEKGDNKYTLVELFPKTGRTHQIRIHMKYLGHPVVSDEFYSGRKNAREDRKWCARLFLHASGIEFIDPTSGRKVKFSSKLPNDLKLSLESMKRT